MDKFELRKKDFITSLILIGFGIFMIIYTFSYIPMKDSWGGVMNVWYVSPGLFPVCIGGLLVLMGIILCQRAIKDGGAERFFKDLFAPKKFLSDRTFRFLGILLVIITYVYLYIPRIDYFLSTLLTLMVFISFFYFERHSLLKKLFNFYLLGSLTFLILFLLGLDKPLNERFKYTMDLLVFLFFIAYIGFSRVLIKNEEDLKRRWRVSVIMSIIPSLVLIPSFKYFLLVPFPVEGGFIELMNILRYALR